MIVLANDFDPLTAFAFEDLLHCCPCITTPHLICLIVISVLLVGPLGLLKQIFALLWIVVSWKCKVKVFTARQQGDHAVIRFLLRL